MLIKKRVGRERLRNERAGGRVCSGLGDEYNGHFLKAGLDKAPPGLKCLTKR